MVELGVPGFLGFVALMFSIVAGVWRTVRLHLRTRTSIGYMSAGIFAFFVANVGSLAVSGQILSDSFIAVFLGFLVGVVLGFARTPFLSNAGAQPAAPRAMSGLILKSNLPHA